MNRLFSYTVLVAADSIALLLSATIAGVLNAVDGLLLTLVGAALSVLVFFSVFRILNLRKGYVFSFDPVFMLGDAIKKTLFEFY